MGKGIINHRLILDTRLKIRVCLHYKSTEVFVLNTYTNGSSRNF